MLLEEFLKPMGLTQRQLAAGHSCPLPEDQRDGQRPAWDDARHRPATGEVPGDVLQLLDGPPIAVGPVPRSRTGSRRNWSRSSRTPRRHHTEPDSTDSYLGLFASQPRRRSSAPIPGYGHWSRTKSTITSQAPRYGISATFTSTFSYPFSRNIISQASLASSLRAIGPIQTSVIGSSSRSILSSSSSLRRFIWLVVSAPGSSPARDLSFPRRDERLHIGKGHSVDRMSAKMNGRIILIHAWRVRLATCDWIKRLLVPRFHRCMPTLVLLFGREEEMIRSSSLHVVRDTHPTQALRFRYTLDSLFRIDHSYRSKPALSSPGSNPMQIHSHRPDTAEGTSPLAERGNVVLVSSRRDGPCSSNTLYELLIAAHPEQTRCASQEKPAALLYHSQMPRSSAISHRW